MPCECLIQAAYCNLDVGNERVVLLGYDDNSIFLLSLSEGTVRIYSLQEADDTSILKKQIHCGNSFSEAYEKFRKLGRLLFVE